jgi:hypothetical protein
MSERFFERFTEMLFGVIMIILLFLGTITVFLVYISTQNSIFYYFYVGTLFFSFAYTFNYSRQFKHFKETLYLFIPSEKPIELLEMEVEDLPLKCALYYRNGASFEKIARSYGLPERESAKRKVVEGLDILLKFYQENNYKVIA